MSTVVMDTDKPISRTDQLAEISQKLDLMAQSIGVLGAQVNYLMERAEADRRRQQTWDDLFEDLTPVVNDMYHVAETQFEEMQQFVTDMLGPLLEHDRTHGTGHSGDLIRVLTAYTSHPTNRSPSQPVIAPAAFRTSGITVCRQKAALASR